MILGTNERAKLGLQHSSRIVSCTRSTQPLLVGRPALMRRCLALLDSTAALKSPETNSEPLSVLTALSFQPAMASSCARPCSSAWQ